MKKMKYVLILPVLISVAVFKVFSQGKGEMSFFITSVGSGDGANLGGLDGADGHCLTLAQSVGSSDRTWRAYLSTNGKKGVNARDRIGSGPWYNAKGVQIAGNLDELHYSNVDLNKETQLTEKGDIVNGRGDDPNQHDILTGSQIDGTRFTDGMDHTCQDWTSNASGTAQVGHHDRTGGGFRFRLHGIQLMAAVIAVKRICSQPEVMGTSTVSL